MPLTTEAFGFAGGTRRVSESLTVHLPQGAALDMCLLIGFLLFTALLFGLGFALHVLWWIALIFLIFWIIGLAIRPRGGRWYYW
jgi:hypothetical protein